MRKNRLLILLVLFISVLLVLAACGGGGGGTVSTCVDASGTWAITETGKPNDCGATTDPTYDLVVTQASGSCSITVTDPSSNVFNGTVTNNTLKWSGSYPEDGGWTTITSMTATMDGNSLGGSANWTWSETHGGATACSGSTTFTGTRTSGGNTAPVANAGNDQSVATGATVTLNGSGSLDDDGDTLTYSWTMTSRPTGSGATLSGANTVSPSFIADAAGAYTISLVVNDGTVNSTADSVTVTATTGGGGNTAPVANAGANKDVTTGLVAFLNGSDSFDADGDTLTYNWTMPSQPGGSTATLTNATTAKPYFTPDADGAYTLSLVVNDGTVDSSPDSVTLTAAPLNVEAMAVGAWQGSIACGDAGDSVGWFLCPGGRLRGYERVYSTDYVDCGTWSVNASDHVIPVYTAKDTKIGDTWDGIFLDFIYSKSTDTLQWNAGCTLVLQRLVGGVTEADCVSTTCTAGGNGDITGCGTDADCGRCWYCDAGTCRYGGEGPYGCYRGWEPPQ
jgi:hypothetical protein